MVYHHFSGSKTAMNHDIYTMFINFPQFSPIFLKFSSPFQTHPILTWLKTLPLRSIGSFSEELRTWIIPVVSTSTTPMKKTGLGYPSILMGFPLINHPFGGTPIPGHLTLGILLGFSMDRAMEHIVGWTRSTCPGFSTKSRPLRRRLSRAEGSSLALSAV